MSGAFITAKTAFDEGGQHGDRSDGGKERLALALQAMAGELTEARRERRVLAKQLAALRSSHAALAGELAESRARLVDTADAERRRLERDFHDGVQHDLIGVRLRLNQAVEAMRTDPAAGEQVLMSISAQLDAAIKSVRLLARGIYPAILQECGAAEALRSAALRLPLSVSVVDDGAGRFAERVEVAIYFCCLEALQNVIKHAGDGAAATVRLWRHDGSVCFRVHDNGAGLRPVNPAGGSGLTNMRDRIAAVGGTLSISSSPGEGTTVFGEVPLEADRAVADAPTVARLGLPALVR